MYNLHHFDRYDQKKNNHNVPKYRVTDRPNIVPIVRIDGRLSEQSMVA